MSGNSSRILRNVGLAVGLSAAVLAATGFTSSNEGLLVLATVLFIASCAVGLFGTKVPGLLRRDLVSYFYSPMAYVIAAAFLFAVGTLFVVTLSDFYASSQKGIWQPGGVMGAMLEVLAFIMLFFCPLISMGLFSQERSSGTVEVLMTAPITAFEIVMAKFLAGLLFYLYLLAITLVFVLIMWFVGNPDYGPVISMYVCLVILGCMYISVGLLVSALTRDQIIAAVASFVLLLILFIVGTVSDTFTPTIRSISNFASTANLWETYFKGVIDSRHVIYGLTFTAAMLYLTVRVVEAGRPRYNGHR